MNRFADAMIAGTLMLVAAATARAQICNYAVSATPDCGAPTPISGSVGHHVVLMDVSSSNVTSTQCGILTGHNAWFEVTPWISGPMTITTCHPGTAYDTVLAVYSGGDAGCGGMALVACNDDDQVGQGCVSVCGDPAQRSSGVTIQATAGVRYRFVVGSYNNNISLPCQPCLGVRVTIGDPCGDPPDNLAPTLARELPGTPGLHEVRVDATDAFTLDSEPDPSCSSSPGHTVWYRTTPSEDGRLTFSTCGQLTSYDTVVAIYQDAGNDILVELDCNDDEFGAGCDNLCDSGRSSIASAAVEAGETYLVQVGSYNDNSAGCDPLCLDATLLLETVCEAEITPPEVELLLPPELTSGCVCPGVAIEGWAYDPDGTFDEYTLEYRTVGSTAWQLIHTSSTEVDPPGGILATWNANGVPQGYYVLRLTAGNTCARSQSVERVVWLDTGFDAVSFGPAHGSIRGGDVCLSGTVTDSFCFDQFTADYRAVGDATFLPVDPNRPLYDAPVINSTFAVWDTRSLMDGDYELRVAARTDCGDAATVTQVVEVDNTPPVALLTSPPACAIVDGVVQVRGTADDVNLNTWSLQYTGGNASGWVELNSGTGPVNDAVLADWDVSDLPSCAYTLRLLARDEALLDCTGVVRNTAEYTTSILVGEPCDGSCPEDLDGDGFVGLADLSALLGLFGTTCP